jgi:hypothetical protein
MLELSHAWSALSRGDTIAIFNTTPEAMLKRALVATFVVRSEPRRTR